MGAMLLEPSLQGRKKVCLRLRPNLVVVPQREAGQMRYVLKDPISLRYFRLDERQHFLVRLMDGVRSLEDLQREYEKTYRPDRISLEDLESFVSQLVNNGLVLSNVPQAATLLRGQGEKQLRDRRRQRLLDFLCIRVPLFDPDRLLGWLLPWIGWVFRPVGVCLAMALMLLAGVVLLGNVSGFLARLPTYREFFTPTTVVLLWATYLGVKVLHEFGHGLSCRAQGGEVHEMGLLLLLGFPALYCNVTDAWKLPGKWQRMAVSAAGIYVELILASLAALLWWSSDRTSQVHHLAFAVMLVCSAGTLVVNANPLMRFDGYHLLADWVEIPNLSETGGRILQSWVLRWYGVPVPGDVLAGRGRRLFAGCHAAASFVYRWMVLAGTLYVLHLFLQPYRLGVLCLLAALGVLATGLGLPIWRMLTLVARQGRSRPMNPLRTGVAVAVVLLAVAVIFLVPIPRGVEGLALIQVEPRAFDRVVIPDSGGFLADLRVRDGESVREGQVLAVLTNPRVQIALSANEADHRLRQDQYRARISWLSELRGSEKQAGNDLEQIKFEVESLRQQNSLLRQQARTLILRAPRSGQVFGLQLEEQQGRWLDRGTELCRVGDTQALRAVLLVAPSDHQRIHTGSAARFRVRGSADRSWIGNVLDIAQVDARSIPPQLSTHAGGEVATRQDPTTHQEQPHEQHYLVAVHLAQTGRMLHPGALGRLRIEAEPRTLAWRVRRYLALTFHWGL